MTIPYPERTIRPTPTPAVGPMASLGPRSTSPAPFAEIARPTNYTPVLPTLPTDIPYSPAVPPPFPYPSYQNPFMPPTPPDPPVQPTNPNPSSSPAPRVPQGQPPTSPPMAPPTAQMPTDRRLPLPPRQVSAQIQANRVLRYYGDDGNLVIVVAWDVISTGIQGVRIMGADQRHHIIPWHRVYELAGDPNDPILNM